MRMNICCIIPAYNEQGNLPELTGRLTAAFDKQKLAASIFFVLQGDKDNVTIVKTLQRRHPRYKLEYVWNPLPLGIGAAYQVGFSRIPNSSTHILTMDADLNHDPADIPKFIAAINKGEADYVIGSRFIQSGAFNDHRGWKRLVSRSVNRLVMLATRLPIHDLTSGYRLIRREVLDTVGPLLKEQGYPAYMELALTAHRAGFRLIEVPIVYSPRTWGESKMKITDTLVGYVSFLRQVISDSLSPRPREHH